MDFCFVELHARIYPVRLMCRVLGVSPSGYSAGGLSRRVHEFLPTGACCAWCIGFMPTIRAAMAVRRQRPSRGFIHHSAVNMPPRRLADSLLRWVPSRR